jgi:hypothetical protein
MNPEIKKLWLEALRSDSYKQGLGNLRNEKDQFCCLGVLCDLHNEEMWGDRWKILPADKFGIVYYEYAERYDLPPEEVCRWAGLPNANPEIHEDGKPLAILNDEGWTFEQLADLIEQQL